MAVGEGVAKPGLPRTTDTRTVMRSVRSARLFAMIVATSLTAGPVALAVATPAAALAPTPSVLINFDDLVAPCVYADSSATTLQGRYLSQGVAFSGPDGTTATGARILNQCGNFGVTGHSPHNFLAFNAKIGFDDPETATFTNPVNNLSFKIGGQPASMTARAFNAAGAVIETQTGSYGFSLLNVTMTASGIKRLEINATSTGHWVIDDVSWNPAPADTTPPVITVNTTVPDGTNGWFTTNAPVSFDVTDAESAVTSKSTECDATTIESDTVGTTRTCTATSSGGTDTKQVTIKRDATAPVVSGADTADTVWRNAPLTSSYTASDATSGLLNPADASFDLSATAESTSATTATAVSKTVTDNAGNATTRKLSALIDLTKPVIVDDGTTAVANAATWHNVAITNTFRRSDALSGLPVDTAPTEDVSTGTAEGTAVQVSSSAVSDVAGNTAPAISSAAFKIDLTKPTVSLTNAPTDGSTVWSTQATPTCTASDALSGLAAPCSVTGWSAAVGTHTVTASATDKAGNFSTASSTYTVRDMTSTGFYNPVDMGGAYNTVKGGSTVPLKFNVLVNGVQQTSTSVVTRFTATTTSCSAPAPVDDIEMVTTGGTELRYDATGAQFIQNWKTPTGAGTCYRATATLSDGDTITALFKLK